MNNIVKGKVFMYIQVVLKDKKKCEYYVGIDTLYKIIISKFIDTYEPVGNAFRFHTKNKKKKKMCESLSIKFT